MATKKKVDETELGDNQVKTLPGIPDGAIDREPVDREKANKEAVGGPEPIEATEADNPSPGRNAVPVTADPATSGKFAPEDADQAEEDVVPGTNVVQPSAPKAGDPTL